MPVRRSNEVAYSEHDQAMFAYIGFLVPEYQTDRQAVCTAHGLLEESERLDAKKQLDPKTLITSKVATMMASLILKTIPLETRAQEGLQLKDEDQLRPW